MLDNWWWFQDYKFVFSCFMMRSASSRVTANLTRTARCSSRPWLNSVDSVRSQLVDSIIIASSYNASLAYSVHVQHLDGRTSARPFLCTVFLFRCLITMRSLQDILSKRSKFLTVASRQQSHTIAVNNKVNLPSSVFVLAQNGSKLSTSTDWI